ncbi:hypothetical protein [Streptosporangium sp. NPDC048865]|uniref:hypothetical protein n=1 Tax=Streptosporangium sp. NPDC048865 TaxID=3155766 RepID=UPI003421F86C
MKGCSKARESRCRFGNHPRLTSPCAAPSLFPDFYLTAADREDQRGETLATASRLFLALVEHDPTARALVVAMPEVFPWVRHLTSAELRAFTLELVEALSDAAELDVDLTTQEVIAGWRATARIKADPARYAQAREATRGDLGPVEVSA